METHKSILLILLVLSLLLPLTGCSQDNDIVVTPSKEGDILIDTNDKDIVWVLNNNSTNSSIDPKPRWEELQ